VQSVSAVSDGDRLCVFFHNSTIVSIKCNLFYFIFPNKITTNVASYEKIAARSHKVVGLSSLRLL